MILRETFEYESCAAIGVYPIPGFVRVRFPNTLPAEPT
jgi:hypothetical protein